MSVTCRCMLPVEVRRLNLTLKENEKLQIAVSDETNPSLAPPTTPGRPAGTQSAAPRTGAQVPLDDVIYKICYT